MSPLKIGTATVETAEIVSFDFNLHETDPEPGYGEHAVLHANFRNGDSATSEGDEAVTLKVLLASIGLTDLHDAALNESHTMGENAGPAGLTLILMEEKVPAGVSACR